MQPSTRLAERRAERQTSLRHSASAAQRLCGGHLGADCVDKRDDSVELERGLERVVQP